MPRHPPQFLNSPNQAAAYFMQEQLDGDELSVTVNLMYLATTVGVICFGVLAYIFIPKLWKALVTSFNSAIMSDKALVQDLRKTLLLPDPADKPAVKVITEGVKVARQRLQKDMDKAAARQQAVAGGSA